MIKPALARLRSTLISSPYIQNAILNNSKLFWLTARLTFNDPYQALNHRHRVIFIHIPKNAGTSIEQTLFKEKVGHKTIFQFQTYSQHCFDQYFKFCVVRNPYDRLVSAFHFLKSGGKNESDKKWAEAHLHQYADFKSFVDHLNDGHFAQRILQWQHFRPQFYYVIDLNNKLNIDHIMKYETLHESIIPVLNYLNAPQISLQHSNQSSHQTWQDYYSLKMKQVVYKLFERDFKK